MPDYVPTTGSTFGTLAKSLDDAMSKAASKKAEVDSATATLDKASSELRAAIAEIKNLREQMNQILDGVAPLDIKKKVQ